MKKKRIQDQSDYILSMLDLVDKATTENPAAIPFVIQQIRLACHSINRNLAGTTAHRVAGESAIHAAIRVLKAAGQPLPVGKIAKATGHPYGNIAAALMRERQADYSRVRLASEGPNTWAYAGTDTTTEESGQ